MQRAAWAMVVGLAAGCATPYVYRPAEESTARVQGSPAARYDVPPESPRGDIKIAAVGITKLTSDVGERQAVWMRYVIDNESDSAWNFDAEKQKIVFPDGDQIAPLIAKSEDGNGSKVTIPPKEKRTIDLFYPLPKEFAKASRLPEFDVAWSVNTPGREVAKHTSFERIEVYTATYPPPYYSWGPYPFYWWF